MTVGSAILGCLALGGGAVAEAQERQRVQVEGVTPGGVNVWMTRRARLGVLVNMQARESDSIGAYIEGVTPGGPADKAGLATGDVITKLDGKSLLGTDDLSSKDRSIPGMRLIEMASKLDANDTVKVEYRRGAAARTATIVTQDDPAGVFTVTPDGPGGMRDFAFRFGDDNWKELQRVNPDMRFDMERMYGGSAGPMRMYFSRELEDLELVPLNPELGEYFGVSEGVLVVRVPKESTLGLKGGDVVLAIDGRKVTSTSQLHRILRTYEADEAIKFDIQRSRKKQAVTGKAPKRIEAQWKTPGGGSVKLRQKSGERT